MAGDSLPSDAELATAAKLYLVARDSEWECRQRLIRMLDQRNEGTLLVGDSVIARKDDSLDVKIHLRVG